MLDHKGNGPTMLKADGLPGNGRRCLRLSAAAPSHFNPPGADGLKLV
ncbi:MAG: hypothetical protein ACJ8EL_10815 [Rhizomicrobium sp.]